MILRGLLEPSTRTLKSPRRDTATISSVLGTHVHPTCMSRTSLSPRVTTCKQLPLATSHILIVLSLELVASLVPSLFQATPVTEAVCSVIECSFSCDSESKMNTLRSDELVAYLEPSGLKRTSRTKFVWSSFWMGTAAIAIGGPLKKPTVISSPPVMIAVLGEFRMSILVTLRVCPVIWPAEPQPGYFKTFAKTPRASVANAMNFISAVKHTSLTTSPVTGRSCICFIFSGFHTRIVPPSSPDAISPFGAKRQAVTFPV
mmetsp:Transcript_1084/g.2946  ORF Transcript_1084/g.2946 Transcript_1084/m.2946 type:complete len:259 (+) Transcript_1084:3060-3836(+)